MIKKVTRRLRCEVQGCHKHAVVGLGIKGNDYPLCEKHLKMLAEEMKDLFPEYLGIKAKKTATTKEKEPETVTETVVEVKAEPVVEEKPVEEEYYVCKTCGEKFLKSEYTPAKFATHVRKCNAEHRFED